MEALRKAAGSHLNFPLKRIARIPTKGICRLYIRPETEENLLEALRRLADSGMPVFTCGFCFNTLWGEGFFNGAVLDLTALNGISVSGETITAQAGVPLARLVKKAFEHSLSGLEELFGIPGSVGAAVFMNAGAFGKEIKDLLESIRIVTEKGEVKTLKKDEVPFGYRSSGLAGKIVLEARFKLKRDSKEKILERIRKTAERRRKKFPKGASLGCVFKNPPEGPAGKIIDKLGLKGLELNGVSVSRKHANFIVASGGSSRDFLELVNRIKDEVFKKTGIILKEEIRYAGSFV